MAADVPNTDPAIARHGEVEVRHYANRGEVSIYMYGQHFGRISDSDGRGLAACLGELFPSMIAALQAETVKSATAERSAQNARDNTARMAAAATRSGEAVYRVQSYADRCAEMARQDPGRVVSRALVARELNDAIKGEL